ncbi:hypothetical protein HPO_08459 [Hyphomonas polymorpha PS728]|uniref:Uncharacterized protein n=1 Tax=Hyphomonas polymorpha PS728 TaxID=1280954 RepID=A0A062VK29_9PROT|nr:hypothetical protein BBF93_09560 [Hyphomonas sp. CACIAM 19H1]KCZ98918.1 hypothetical protein HPO_08459 [Hyphomonas polymorpha PS728]
MAGVRQIQRDFSPFITQRDFVQPDTVLNLIGEYVILKYPDDGLVRFKGVDNAVISRAGREHCVESGVGADIQKCPVQSGHHFNDEYRQGRLIRASANGIGDLIPAICFSNEEVSSGKLYCDRALILCLN